jgi:hypothetical protein
VDFTTECIEGTEKRGEKNGSEDPPLPWHGVVGGRDKLSEHPRERKADVADNEEGFKVIDRRPFTAEGEIRKEVLEEKEREAKREEVKEKAAEKKADTPKPAAADTPKRLPAFENLIRMIGSNAAMVLGAYADPNTGQPMLDPDAARELIDMLDALHEKTKGNLAPEEDSMLLDLVGKLKLTYLEIQKAMAAEIAKVTAQAKGRK